MAACVRAGAVVKTRMYHRHFPGIRPCTGLVTCLHRHAGMVADIRAIIARQPGI